jgi:hypothetical protein
MPADPPPPELLSSWLGSKGATSTTKARGRSGPNTATTPANGTINNTGLLLQTLSLAFTMFANNSAHNITQTASASLTLPASEQNRLSSPPPAIEDELDACLTAFGIARRLASDVVERAIADLHEVDYSPDAICEAASE